MYGLYEMSTSMVISKRDPLKTISDLPVVSVAVSRLRVGESPRSNGLDQDHAKALAETAASLPPILVLRSTMQVIDGMHRVRAAELNGREYIAARLFDGKKEDAFLLAVRSNIKHGLPLTLSDRKEAAARVITTHPSLSDRSIAFISGLSAATVAAIRRSLDGTNPLDVRRIGRDGRIRPLSANSGRQIAEQMVLRQPQITLRELARQAGISLGTAASVRRSVRAGQDCLATKREPVSHEKGTSASSGAADPIIIIDSLCRDPSLRYSERGRHLLKWIRSRIVTRAQWKAISEEIPVHCVSRLSELARANANMWCEIARELDQQTNSSNAISTEGRKICLKTFR